MFYLIDRGIAGYDGRDRVSIIQKEGDGQGLVGDPNPNHQTLKKV